MLDARPPQVVFAIDAGVCVAICALMLVPPDESTGLAPAYAETLMLALSGALIFLNVCFALAEASALLFRRAGLRSSRL